MRAMFEIDYGNIEIVHAADGFQGITSSAREMANTADLRQRVGYRFFQFIVVGEQKHNWRFHASTLLDRSNSCCAAIANCRAFFAREFGRRLSSSALKSQANEVSLINFLALSSNKTT